MLNIKYLFNKQNALLSILNFLLINVISLIRSSQIFISFYVFRSLINQGLTISSWDNQTITFVVLFVLSFMIDPIIVTIFNYLFRIQFNRATKNFSMHIYNSFYSLNITKSKKMKKEDLLNMVSNDFAQYMQSLIGYIMFFISSLVSVIASIVFIGLIDWILLLSFIGITVLTQVISYVKRVLTNKIDVQKSRINEKFLGLITKKFEVFIMYLNNGYKIPFVTKALEIIGFRNKQFNIQENKKVMIGIPELILNLSATLIIFGILWGAFKGTPNAREIAIIAIGITQFSSFRSSFVQLVDSLGARNQYKQFEAKINEIYATFSTDISQKYNKKVTSISLENIAFSAENKQIIENLNLNINQGDKVLISGKSGAGKSTIISMILNELKPTSGKVLINNSILEENISIADNVSYAYNENFIIDGTLIENISFENENKVSNEKINFLKNKLFIDYISDNKANINELDLSEGQKQKIVLARALYHEKDLYILDEATSNLDTKTKESFEKLLEELNKTVIFISHTKLETSDKIFNKKLIFNEEENKWVLLKS